MKILTTLFILILVPVMCCCSGEQDIDGNNSPIFNPINPKVEFTSESDSIFLPAQRLFVGFDGIYHYDNQEIVKSVFFNKDKTNKPYKDDTDKPYKGEWFELIPYNKKDNKKGLMIKVSHNETGKERKIIVCLWGPSVYDRVQITQK